MKYDYDIAVIGGGAAGLMAAKTSHGMGKKTILIEKNKLNNELASIEIPTISGIPSFIDPWTISINNNSIKAKKYIIATGSSPIIPLIKGLESIPYFTNENFFDQSSLPKSVIIIGAGSIGIELATKCHHRGITVTIVEKHTRILPQEDAQIVTIIHDQLSKKSVTLLTNSSAITAIKYHNGIQITYEDIHNIEQKLYAEALLIATGRHANIHGLGLENIGISIEKHAIKTNHYMQTNYKHIYACGDVVGPYTLRHMAWYQAITAARNACIPIFKQKIDPNLHIWKTFSSPEYARLGLTEQEAKNKYGDDNIVVYTRSYDTLDRAHTDNSTIGMAKIICNKKKYILGAHIVGQNAADIIHELAILKQKKISFDELHKIIHIYSTYAELLWHMSRKSYLDSLQNKLAFRILKKIIDKK